MANGICIRQTLAETGFLLAAEKEVFVIYDENVSWVAQEVIPALQEACGEAAVRGCIGLETSEEGKTLESVLALGRKLLEADATRAALLLAIGGGITTDVVGFTAAIYKRGIRYANIPTTLLAMVDATIGGKTGVNLDGYKNMLGAFRMPEFTLVCPQVLQTLPEREYKAGLAEMLKTFLLADGELYREAVKLFSATQNDRESSAPCANPALFAHGEGKTTRPCAKPALFAHGEAEFIGRAAEIKAAIVQRDPLEHGERAKLNLGHTFGHAIEHTAREKGADISHGEAVAMGILLAARVSEGAGIAPGGLTSELTRDFSAVGLPTQCPYPLQELVAAMHKDKKATGRQVRFVLPETPGKVVLKEMTPEQAYDCYLAAK